MHIVFVMPGKYLDELLVPAARSGVPKYLDWTAPRTARSGDVALVYAGGAHRGLLALATATERAWPGVPGDWTDSRKGWFARYVDIHMLSFPIGLDEIREAFPTWGRWSILKGVRVHTVPERFRRGLSTLVAGQDPDASRWLRPWLNTAEEPPEAPVAAPVLEGAPLGANRYLKVVATENPLPRNDSGYDLAEALVERGRGSRVSQQEFLEIVDAVFEVPARRRARILRGLATEMIDDGICKLACARRLA